MKHFFTFVLAALCFAACTQNEFEELTADRADVPETLTVGFEGGDTRIELNEALKTVWTKGDLASVFYKSDANQKWAYQGETGERLGTLKCVDAGTATTRTDLVVVAYPYNTNYIFNRTNGNIEASLPAVQSYKDGSYGSEGNIMVAQSEFTQFSLKSVCGWLRVELTGEGESVESITLRGNAGEQIAGLIYVDTATAEATLASEMGEASDEEQVGGVGGGLEFDDTVFTEVTLNCGEGVELGAEAKAFYIGLLPQTFAEGVTIEVNCAGYKPMTLSTESSITIERNHIKPMAAVEHEAGVILPSNELWYTATALVEPNNTSAFNVAIVSNEWDETTGEGVITFDGELTTIGDYAFSVCDSLTSITIGDSVTTIGDGAFEGCSSLTSVTIGDSVTTIGDYAFRGCGSLTSVTIPDSVTTIGDGAFAGCIFLAEFKGKFAADGGRCLIIDGVLNAFAWGCGVTEYTIPDSVTTIGNDAFYGCSSLTSITIPNSVTTIGDFAFYYCSSLTSVTIPDSVTTIGNYAFSVCESLTSVTIGDSVTKIGNWAFYECSSLTNVTIPDSVTTIGYLAFAYCESLTSVTIGDSVKTIGDGAFEGCSSLTSVTIPDSVKTIRNSAFYLCTSLTSVTIGDSVTKIGDFAFAYCSSLTSVTIPDSVLIIDYGAFSNCSNLTTVYCRPIVPPTKTNYEYGHIFDTNIEGFCIYVPEDYVDTYINDESWSIYADYIVGYPFDDITYVDNKIIKYKASAKIEPYDTSAFGATYLESTWDEATGEGVITFDGNVSKIGDNAFRYSTALQNITIPNSVASIGNYAFSESGIRSLELSDRVTTIGNYAFHFCYNLEGVALGDNITSIGDEAFSYCGNLHEIDLGSGQMSIGYRAFAGCLIHHITIPENATLLGNVFAGCSLLAKFEGNYATDDGIALISRDMMFGNEFIAFAPACRITEYTIPADIMAIVDQAFYDCDSLTSVTIPDSVTTIGDEAFWSCESLTSVTIGDGVTAIGEAAFASCSSLTEFKGKFAEDGGRCLIKDNAIIAYANASGTTYTIPDSVTTIGDYAFNGCDNLTSVTIPDSVTTIGYRAFAYCESLTSITIPDSVTTIGHYAFWYCESLTSLYCEATTPPTLGVQVLWGEDNNWNYVMLDCDIYVPAESVEAYKAAENWSEYAAKIVGYDFERGEVVE